jgi:hypothetical protein
LAAAPSYFNDFQEKMSFIEALAILPKNTRISLDTTGSLTINGHTRDEFVAHNCPFKPIDDDGNMWEKLTTTPKNINSLVRGGT